MRPNEYKKHWKSYLVIIFIFILTYPTFLKEYGYRYLHISNVDFPSFWCAAKATFSQSVSPYNLDTLKSLLDVEHIYPYLYPPSSLLLFYPLSYFTYDTARIVVLIFNHSLILLLLPLLFFKILKLSINRDIIEIIVGFVFIYFFHPIVILLNHGQVNLLLLFLLLGFWIMTNRNNNITSAIFLVLAILLKTYPLIFIPFLIVTKKFKLLLYVTLFLSIISILSYIVLPNNVWSDWFINVLPSGGYANTPKDLFSPASIYNQSLNGFFSRLFTVSEWSPNPVIESQSLARIATYLVATILFFISLFGIRRVVIANDKYSFDWVMLIVLPLMFLISPLSWEHHLVYLLGTIILLIVAVLQGKIKYIPIVLLIILSSLIIGANGLLAFKFFAVLSLWFVSVFLLYKREDIFSTKSKF